MSQVFSERRRRLLEAIRGQGAGAVLVTKFINVTYLTGFTGDDSYLYLADDRAVMLSDSRYDVQLQAECPDIELEIRQTPATMLDLIAKVARDTTTLAVESDNLSMAEAADISGKLQNTQLAPCRGLLDRLREIKDETELAAIRRAIALAEDCMRQLQAGLRRETTEQQAAADLEHLIRRGGGSGCSFPPILAVGANAALPHARPTGQPIGAAPLLLTDWGAVVDGYMSDLTRVWLTDKITPEIETVYGVVATAQQLAIDAIHPGARIADVDAAARSHIADAGYGAQFGHGLGHGFGLEIHEQPRLAPGMDRQLEAGMVVTVEPGIYLPGKFGVRIEDDVLVTPDGHQVLSSISKRLEDCHLPLA